MIIQIFRKPVKRTSGKIRTITSRNQLDKNNIKLSLDNIIFWLETEHKKRIKLDYDYCTADGADIKSLAKLIKKYKNKIYFDIFDENIKSLIFDIKNIPTNTHPDANVIALNFYRSFLMHYRSANLFKITEVLNYFVCANHLELFEFNNLLEILLLKSRKLI